jgi:hypothetical protein
MAVVIAGSAGLTLAASFTWTGDGPNDLWVHGGNWDISGVGANPYPSTTNDDATFPAEEYNDTVDIRTYEIDDLSTFRTVYFGSDTASQTLTCDSVTLYGELEDVQDWTVVGMADGATIETN